MILSIDVIVAKWLPRTQRTAVYQVYRYSNSHTHALTPPSQIVSNSSTQGTAVYTVNDYYGKL